LVKEKISGYFFNDEETQESMREVFSNSNYVLCPHTAIAYRGLEEYRKNSDGNFTGVFLSTAHPAKFIDLVEETLGKSVEIPERLKLLLSIQKVSVKMKPSYLEFKSFLLSKLS
jgi:threonine synthase